MAKIYCDLIKKALKTLEDVPLRWKDQVIEMLDAE
ncbi:MULTISPECIES: CD1375 family protein [Paenibacillus]|nr:MULTISPECIES: CD1375 family protein [Paenibacillus]